MLHNRKQYMLHIRQQYILHNRQQYMLHIRQLLMHTRYMWHRRCQPTMLMYMQKDKHTPMYQHPTMCPLMHMQLKDKHMTKYQQQTKYNKYKFKHEPRSSCRM